MTIKEHLYLAAEIIGGKAWGIDKGVYPRIYMPSRRDMKVYFEFTCAAYEEATDSVGISTLEGPTRTACEFFCDTGFDYSFLG